MSTSENKSDKKLEAFLKENRPLYPRHSEREAEKIWARVSSEADGLRPGRARGQRPLIFGGSIAAVALTVVIGFHTSWNSPVPTNLAVIAEKTPTTAAMTSADLIEDSLELGFLENEEMYEVTDLISLGK